MAEAENSRLKRLTGLLARRTPGLMDAGGHYAVLVPLVRREGELFLLYEVRAKTLRRQPGEVCFPGGHMEPGESPRTCALREAWEELGLPAHRVEVLGPLDFIAHRSNFILYPVLGLVEWETLEGLRLNRDEVEETFLVPLSHLMETVPIEYEYGLIPYTGEGFPYDLLGIPRDYDWQVGRESGPVYPWEGKAIWGMTGKITRHLISLLKQK